jgi:hypothetical protein
MAPKKRPPKDCRQRGVCKFYEKCPFAHNARLCIQADGITPEGTLPIEVA